MVYSTKPATFQELWQEIEWSCATFPVATLVTTCQSVAYSYQLCHKANGGHFEQLHKIH
jgi:hypothetical protein